MRRCGGYTFIEILVTVLIMGVLAAFAVPAYRNASEVAKAEDGLTLLKTIGNANRMFAADHGGNYAGEWRLLSSCNEGACDGSTHYCQLIRCKYVQPRDWDNLPWQVHIAKPSAVGDCTPWLPPGPYVACANRKNANGGANVTDWAYSMNADGVITAYHGAPEP